MRGKYNVNGEIKDYGERKCMRLKINCETENKGLRGNKMHEGENKW